MSLKTSNRIKGYFNQNTEIEKKMLFTDFWFPAMLFIIMLFVAYAYVPAGKYDAATKSWDGTPTSMEDINMIAYIVLISIIAFTGLWKISVRLYRARFDFSSARNVGHKGKKLVGISSILSSLSCLVYLVLILSLPFAFADDRVPLVFEGNTAINGSENTWLVNLMLAPAYFSLISMLYTTILAFSFEYKKRKHGVQWDE